MIIIYNKMWSKKQFKQHRIVHFPNASSILTLLCLKCNAGYLLFVLFLSLYFWFLRSIRVSLSSWGPSKDLPVPYSSPFYLTKSRSILRPLSWINFKKLLFIFFVDECILNLLISYFSFDFRFLDLLKHESQV